MKCSAPKGPGMCIQSVQQRGSLDQDGFDVSEHLQEMRRMQTDNSTCCDGDCVGQRWSFIRLIATRSRPLVAGIDGARDHWTYRLICGRLLTIISNCPLCYLRHSIASAPRFGFLPRCRICVSHVSPTCAFVTSSPHVAATAAIFVRGIYHVLLVTGGSMKRPVRWFRLFLYLFHCGSLGSRLAVGCLVLTVCNTLLRGRSI